MAIIERRHRIALDPMDTIIEEYRRNLGRGSVGAQWLQHMLTKGPAPERTYKALSRRDRTGLDDLGFDSDDVVFVEVATRTSSQVLVACESDYTIEVKAYLQTRLRVLVVDPLECLELL